MRPPVSDWRIGDIVQRGCSDCAIVAIADPENEDYATIRVRCLKSNDDFISTGEEDECFAGRLAWIRRR